LAGVPGVVRRHHTAREKLSIISKIRCIKQQTNVSYCQAATTTTVGICHTIMFCWHAIRERYNNIDIKMLPRYLAFHGPCGQLESVKEEHLAWFFERRETGLVVLTLSVIIKACCLLPLMEQKLTLACYMVTCCLLKKHLIVYRMGTKVSQCPPSKVCQEAMEFQDFIRPILQRPEHDLRCIINMDQSPVFFLMHPKKALEILGINKRHVINDMRKNGSILSP